MISKTNVVRILHYRWVVAALNTDASSIWRVILQEANLAVFETEDWGFRTKAKERGWSFNAWRNSVVINTIDHGAAGAVATRLRLQRIQETGETEEYAVVHKIRLVS